MPTPPWQDESTRRSASADAAALKHEDEVADTPASPGAPLPGEDRSPAPPVRRSASAEAAAIKLDEHDPQ